jgi:hypothetical protein
MWFCHNELRRVAAAREAPDRSETFRLPRGSLRYGAEKKKRRGWLLGATPCVLFRRDLPGSPSMSRVIPPPTAYPLPASVGLLGEQLVQAVHAPELCSDVGNIVQEPVSGRR